MRIRYAAKTEQHPFNVGYFAVMEEESLFVVADGMEQERCGDVASRLACDVVSEFYRRTQDKTVPWPYALDRELTYDENRLVCAIKLANYKVHEAATNDPRLAGMCTALIAGIICGDKIHVAGVGSCRCYRLRDDAARFAPSRAKVEQLLGAPPLDLALGRRATIQMELRSDEICDRDTFLFCSDGASRTLSNDELVSVLRSGGRVDVTRVVDQLVTRANEAGCADNVTAIVIHCLNHN